MESFQCKNYTQISKISKHTIHYKIVDRGMGEFIIVQQFVLLIPVEKFAELFKKVRDPDLHSERLTGRKH